jgi:hypothetical protein
MNWPNGLLRSEITPLFGRTVYERNKPFGQKELQGVISLMKVV